jgi:hypothetical protein
MSNPPDLILLGTWTPGRRARKGAKSIELVVARGATLDEIATEVARVDAHIRAAEPGEFLPYCAEQVRAFLDTLPPARQAPEAP